MKQGITIYIIYRWKNKKIMIPRNYQSGIIFLGLFITLFFLFCFGCGLENKKDNKAGTGKKVFWYELNDGSLIKAESLTGRESKSLLPWTVQERITDIAFLNNRIYTTVNQYGIQGIDPGSMKEIQFTPYYDPEYFMFKTITTLLPCSDGKENNQSSGSTPGILCHLYFNSMIFPFQVDELLYDNANIIKLTHSEKGLIIEELYPPLPEVEPTWEIVRLNPTGENVCYIEWKNSHKLYSEFKYSRYSPDGLWDEEITWEEFLDAYGFISITDPGIPNSLYLLCEYIITESGRKKNNTTFHFFVENKSTHITQRYIHEAAIPITNVNFEIVTVRLLEEEEGYCALVTDLGYIYYINKKDNKIRTLNLPELPDHFYYTEFIIHDNNLLLAWEESIFVNVGAAGLLILKDTDLH